MLEAATALKDWLKMNLDITLSDSPLHARTVVNELRMDVRRSASKQY
jgi:hypothetical protein